MYIILTERHYLSILSTDIYELAGWIYQGTPVLRDSFLVIFRWKSSLFHFQDTQAFRMCMRSNCKYITITVSAWCS